MRISFNTFRPYNTNCNSNNSVNQQKRSQNPTFTKMDELSYITNDIVDNQDMFDSTNGDTKKCIEGISEMVFGYPKIPEPKDYFTEIELEHFHDAWNKACEEDSD